MKKTFPLLFVLSLLLTGCVDYGARKDSDWAIDARGRADHAYELSLLDDELGIVSSYIDREGYYSYKEAYQAIRSVSENVYELQSVLKELNGILKE